MYPGLIREQEFCMKSNNTFHNATTQNNREINTVHNHQLYIATVSIKHKAVECIKTALHHDVRIGHCYGALN